MNEKDKNWLNKDIENLAGVFLEMKTKDEILDFLRDICTIKELETISERWKVCQLLEDGFSYRKINEMTGVSTTTITRVAHWIKYGEGGYKNALNKKNENN